MEGGNAVKLSSPLNVENFKATLDDIKKLYPLSRDSNLEGAITGRAIYEGTLDLKEAMEWINSRTA